jgi:hypothetical protein
MRDFVAAVIVFSSFSSFQSPEAASEFKGKDISLKCLQFSGSSASSKYLIVFD